MNKKYTADHIKGYDMQDPSAVSKACRRVETTLDTVFEGEETACHANKAFWKSHPARYGRKCTTGFEKQEKQEQVHTEHAAARCTEMAGAVLSI